MTEYKLLWSGPENRHLIVNPDAMTLHVLKLDPSAPAPTSPLAQDLVPQLRPLDWGSAVRIVGPAQLEKMVEVLVDQCWPQMTQAALVFINAPDQWPARTSFHAQAAARGTSFSPIRPETASSPLESLGVGGWITQRLSAEIRAKGKFSSIEDVAARVREASRDHIRQSIIQVVTGELSGQPRQAMFFGRRDNKTWFRTKAPPKAAAAEEDEDSSSDPWKRRRV